MARGFLEGGEEKKDGGDGDAGIGHVEAGEEFTAGEACVPGAEAEAEEIDDVAVDKAVGQVPGDAGEEQGGGEFAEAGGEDIFAPHPADGEEGGGGDEAEDVVGPGAAIELAEGHAGIVEPVEPKEARDDLDFLMVFGRLRVVIEDPAEEWTHLEPRSRGIVEAGDRPPLGELVEHVEWEREQEKPAGHAG